MFINVGVLFGEYLEIWSMEFFGIILKAIFVGGLRAQCEYCRIDLIHYIICLVLSNSFFQYFVFHPIQVSNLVIK